MTQQWEKHWPIIQPSVNLFLWAARKSLISISKRQKCCSRCMHLLCLEFGKSINVKLWEAPCVSHRLDKTPAQPSIWNSHCPVKGTERPAQACSYLNVHASPRQLSSGFGQQACRHHTMHTNQEHAVAIRWIPFDCATNVIASVLFYVLCVLCSADTEYTVKVIWLCVCI